MRIFQKYLVVEDLGQPFCKGRFAHADRAFNRDVARWFSTFQFKNEAAFAVCVATVHQ